MTFIQNANDVYPEDYGSDNLFYLWLLLIYLLLCLVNFLTSPMENWFNGEMIPDDAVMMMRQISCGDFTIGYFSIRCYSNGFTHLGRVVEDIYRYSFPVNVFAQDKSRDTHFPGICPGIG